MNILCQRLSLSLHLTQCYCLVMFVPLPRFLEKTSSFVHHLNLLLSSTQGWLTKYVVRNMLLVLGIWHVK